MSVFRPMATATGNLLYLSFFRRKPEPLRKYSKCIAGAVCIVILEFQPQGKIMLQLALSTTRSGLSHRSQPRHPPPWYMTVYLVLLLIITQDALDLDCQTRPQAVSEEGIRRDNIRLALRISYGSRSKNRR